MILARMPFDHAGKDHLGFAQVTGPPRVGRVLLPTGSRMSELSPPARLPLAVPRALPVNPDQVVRVRPSVIYLALVSLVDLAPDPLRELLVGRLDYQVSFLLADIHHPLQRIGIRTALFLAADQVQDLVAVLRPVIALQGNYALRIGVGDLPAAGADDLARRAGSDE